MTEKSYSGTIKPLAPQATFTRMANRLEKEFKETFGSIDYPSVEEAIKSIKNGQPLEEEIAEENSRDMDGFFGSGGKVYDKVTYYEEFRIDFGFDCENDEFYISWYLFKNQTYQRDYFGNKLKGSYDYVHYVTAKIKGEHRYLCTHRPPSPGAVPDGYVTYEHHYGMSARYCGEVTYHERLADEGYALSNYGLVYDKDWQEQRQAIIDSYERVKENE